MKTAATANLVEGTSLTTPSAWDRVFQRVHNATNNHNSALLVSQVLEITHYWYSTSCVSSVYTVPFSILRIYTSYVEDYLFTVILPTLYTTTGSSSSTTKNYDSANKAPKQKTVRIYNELSKDTVLWTFVWCILLKLIVKSTGTIPTTTTPSLVVSTSTTSSMVSRTNNTTNLSSASSSATEGNDNHKSTKGYTDATYNRLDFLIKLIRDYPKYYAKDDDDTVDTFGGPVAYQNLRNMALLVGSIQCTLITDLKGDNTKQNTTEKDEEDTDNNVPYLDELLTIAKLSHRKLYDLDTVDDGTMEDTLFTGNLGTSTTDTTVTANIDAERIMYTVSSCHCPWDICTGFHSMLYSKDLWLYTNYKDMKNGIQSVYVHTTTFSSANLKDKLQIILPVTIGMIDIPIHLNELAVSTKKSSPSTITSSTLNSSTYSSNSLAFLHHAPTLHSSLHQLYVIMQQLIKHYPCMNWDDIPRSICNFMINAVGNCSESSSRLLTLSSSVVAWKTFVKASTSPWSILGLCIGNTLHKYSQSVLGLEVNTVLEMIKTMHLCLGVNFYPKRYMNPAEPSLTTVSKYHELSDASKKIYLFDHGDLVWCDDEPLTDYDKDDSDETQVYTPPEVVIIPYKIIEKLEKYLHSYAISTDSTVTMAVRNLLYKDQYSNYVLQLYNLLKNLDINLSYLWISKYTSLITFPSLPFTSKPIVYTEPSTILPVLHRFHKLVHNLYQDTYTTLNHSSTFATMSVAHLTSIRQICALLNGCTGIVLQDVFATVRLMFTKLHNSLFVSVNSSSTGSQGRNKMDNSKKLKSKIFSENVPHQSTVHNELFTLLMNTLGYSIGILSLCLKFSIPNTVLHTETVKSTEPLPTVFSVIDRAIQRIIANILNNDTVILYIAEILDICMEKVPISLTPLLVQHIYLLEKNILAYATVITKGERLSAGILEPIAVNKWMFLRGILTVYSDKYGSWNHDNAWLSTINNGTLVSAVHPLIPYLYRDTPNNNAPSNHNPYLIPRLYRTNPFEILNPTGTTTSATENVTTQKRQIPMKTKLSSTVTNTPILRSRNRVIDSWLQETLIDEEDEDTGRRKKRTRVRDRYLDLEDFIVE